MFYQQFCFLSQSYRNFSDAKIHIFRTTIKRIWSIECENLEDRLSAD